jgi:class 3 adenylate cyclase
MPARPSGTVTFLFTDIEASTGRWEAHPDLMPAAFARQEAILRAAIAAQEGWAYKQIGDAFQAAFQTAPAAVTAALAAQRALAAEPWLEAIGPLRVRMALHTGAAEERGDDYVGPTLYRAHRLLSAGHGGQILLTAATYELVRDALPGEVSLLDLGEHRLKDLIRSEHIWQVVVAGLPADFPPLKTLNARPNNLPAQPNAFIGREAQIAAVTTLLRRPDVRLFEQAGDRWWTAEVLENPGVTSIYRSEFGRAQPLLEQSLAIWREVGDRLWRPGRALLNLGVLVTEQSDYERAARLFEESLALGCALGNTL